MKKIIYSCDYCKKETTKMHLSIAFDPNEYSGYVEPNEDGKWVHIIKNAIIPNVVSNSKLIKQFCSTRCLGRYFIEGEYE